MIQSSSIPFRSGEHTLVGTLESPGDSTTAALLISGSGPIDRDSNTKRLKIDAMAQVADRLAADGVGSFRYDKRGVGESGGDYRSTGFHDNVADATAALATLRHQPGVESIVVIGHSEGALIAAEMAAHDPAIAGVVLLAGAAQSGERILRWQVTQVADSIPKPVKWLMKLLRQDLDRTQINRLARIRASRADVMRIQGVRINAKWFREFMAYEPGDALAWLTVPVLAITGSKDIQVDPVDLERMRALVPSDFTAHLAEDLTHLLRTEDGPASLRTYRKQVRRPVDSDLLNLVAAWVGARSVAENGTHEPV